MVLYSPHPFSTRIFGSAALQLMQAASFRTTAPEAPEKPSPRPTRMSMIAETADVSMSKQKTARVPQGAGPRRDSLEPRAVWAILTRPPDRRTRKRLQPDGGSFNHRTPPVLAGESNAIGAVMKLRAPILSSALVIAAIATSKLRRRVLRTSSFLHSLSHRQSMRGVNIGIVLLSCGGTSCARAGHRVNGVMAVVIDAVCVPLKTVRLEQERSTLGVHPPALPTLAPPTIALPSCFRSVLVRKPPLPPAAPVLRYLTTASPSAGSHGRKRLVNPILAAVWSRT
ncbi:hypothetical protein C8R46DRAFT_1219522 [Mycena filopes]|nr:hypothetical protein C8R46DRAFT_1219522 [Mycena filopes]